MIKRISLQHTDIYHNIRALIRALRNIVHESPSARIKAPFSRLIFRATPQRQHAYALLKIIESPDHLRGPRVGQTINEPHRARANIGGLLRPASTVFLKICFCHGPLGGFVQPQGLHDWHYFCLVKQFNRLVG